MYVIFGGTRPGLFFNSSHKKSYTIILSYYLSTVAGITSSLWLYPRKLPRNTIAVGPSLAKYKPHAVANPRVRFVGCFAKLHRVLCQLFQYCPTKSSQAKLCGVSIKKKTLRGTKITPTHAQAHTHSNPHAITHASLIKHNFIFFISFFSSGDHVMLWIISETNGRRTVSSIFY